MGNSISEVAKENARKAKENAIYAYEKTAE